MTLPDDKLPECWKDETRINVLFAPIRPRSVNPQDWDSKYTFWKNLINTYCSCNNVFTFKLSELQSAFKRNGRTPSCLGIVVGEMETVGECLHLEKFLENRSDTWSKWAADILVKKPILWTYKTLKSKFVSTDKDVVYVLIERVKEESSNFLSSLPEPYKDKVLNLEELSNLQILEFSTDSLKIILHYLVGHGKASVKELHQMPESNNKDKLKHFLIKINDKKVQPITNTEIGIYTLEQNEKALLTNIEKLESDINQIREEAKQYLKKNHRQMAKSCLRKKHELENCLDKRTNALFNIQTLLSKVHNAHTDAEVLESYKTALSSLQDTFKKSGLSEESVSKTMLELGEVLEIHEDIQTSLSQPIGNDSDVEEELAALIADSNEAQSQIDVDNVTKDLENLTLPDTPTVKPELIRSKVTV